MLLVDAVFIPFTLAAAAALKVGVRNAIALDAWLYAVAFATVFAVFARLGLYRAVVRYIGSAAVKTALIGVSLSALTLLLLNVTLVRRPLPAE